MRDYFTIPVSDHESARKRDACYKKTARRHIRAGIKNPRQNICSDEGGGEEEVVTNILNCKSTSTLQQNYDPMS